MGETRASEWATNTSGQSSMQCDDGKGHARVALDVMNVENRGGDRNVEGFRVLEGNGGSSGSNGLSGIFGLF